MNVILNLNLHVYGIESRISPKDDNHSEWSAYSPCQKKKNMRKCETKLLKSSECR